MKNLYFYCWVFDQGRRFLKPTRSGRKWRGALACCASGPWMSRLFTFGRWLFPQVVWGGGDLNNLKWSSLNRYCAIHPQFFVCWYILYSVYNWQKKSEKLACDRIGKFLFKTAMYFPNFYGLASCYADACCWYSSDWPTRYANTLCLKKYLTWFCTIYSIFILI